ncbi:SitI6 family double-CXXCG motif immunity protein [Myxococcus fulvus]|uniref:SitI6 family double-CXXCG motif immunity protein n=1 Tax=Myxococcus fulvus TaxID=33 RepID=UPI0020C009E6|nr:double-CXXCG motif protein [Myxococcus fulvus]MCK8503813.1 double-CXXCG motif protein [Myxococcus fulvus]
MGRFFCIGEDTEVIEGYGGKFDAEHRWFLPALKDCPGCRASWSDLGCSYPSVDLSSLSEHRSFEENRPESFQELARLRELVRPLLPPGSPLPPGTELGPLTGKALGKLPSFSWLIASLVVNLGDLESLQEQGLTGLVGHPTALTARQKPVTDLVELEILSRGSLHPACFPRNTPAPCSTCGRLALRRPDKPILDAASLPTDLDLFRLTNFSALLIVTERFKDAVDALGLDGLTFLEVASR